MGRYLLRRLLISIPVLLGITMITYLAYDLAPGDPVDAMIDPRTVALSGGAMEQLKKNLGLDQPLPIRYGIWLSQVMRGNLGYSYRTGRPVLQQIGERLPATLQLTVSSLLFGIFTGVPLGIYSAVRKYTWSDYALTFFSFLGISMPAFFFALGAIYIFSLRLNLFPSHGLGDANAAIPWLDRLHHLFLPAMVLGLERIAGFLRYTRSSMLEVMAQDYMTTARAKGLPGRLVLVRHGLRNALISVITLIGLSLPGLFGGAFVIEAIFAWPGIGLLGITAVGHRDYPILMGTALIGSSIVLISNLLADITYAVVDPRIRYS